MFKTLSQRWKRGAVALVTAASIFGMVAFSAPHAGAQAVTIADLQAQINALLAQIATLQGGSSSGVGCYAFTRDLTNGSQGADVVALQDYLKSTGHFSVTVGSTGYFGPITTQAVAAWQSANGVSPAAGYFGPISRARYNAICAPTTPPAPSPSPSPSPDLGGGEADISRFRSSAGDDSEVREGDEGDVFDFEFRVRGGDVEVQRVDLFFRNDSGNGDDEPWKVFDDIELLMNGRRVASIDGSRENNWDDESGNAYRIRFNSVGAVVRDGQTPEFTVRVMTQNTVRNVDSGPQWDIWIPANGIRVYDGEGIDTTFPGSASSAQGFDIVSEGDGEELRVRQSDENPKAQVLEVDDSSTSAWHSVFVFELEARDNDIEIRELPIELEFSTSTYNTIVSNIELVVDGKTFKTHTVTGGSTATPTVKFEMNRRDLVIDEGDRVEAELRIRFKNNSVYGEGVTLVADVSGSAIVARGASTLTGSALKGSATSETHTLRTEGIALTLVSSSAVSPVGNNSARADFKLVFDVMAFGEDFYVEKTAGRGVASLADGARFIIEDSAGDAYTSGTSTVNASLTASGSTTGDTGTHFRVREGQTRRLTLTVNLTNTGGTEGQYRVQLTSVSFDEDGAGASADGGMVTTGLDDFETDLVFVDDETNI